MSAYTSVISGSPVQILEMGNADAGKGFIFAAYPAGISGFGNGSVLFCVWRQGTAFL